MEHMHDHSSMDHGDHGGHDGHGHDGHDGHDGHGGHGMTTKCSNSIELKLTFFFWKFNEFIPTDGGDHSGHNHGSGDHMGHMMMMTVSEYYPEWN